MDSGQILREFISLLFEIVLCLDIDPELRTCAEKFCEPKRSVHRDRALSPNDFRDSGLIQQCAFGKLVGGNTHGIQKIFQKDLAWMNGGNSIFHVRLLVVIHDAYIERISIFPKKTDPPLLIDSEAPFVFSVSQ